jgi:DNA-binding response OmpR family regulator
MVRPPGGHSRTRRSGVRPPFPPRAPRPDVGRTEPAGRAAPRRKTILIVEDNAAFGGLLVALLREDGYRTLRAWDGREAARMARDRKPDLIVLDLALPYRDGVELLHQLKEQGETSQAPIVVVSGNTLQLSTEDRALLADVVTKPFDIDRMINALRRALGDPEHELPDRPSFDYGHEHAY